MPIKNTFSPLYSWKESAYLNLTGFDGQNINSRLVFIVNALYLII